LQLGVSASLTTELDLYTFVAEMLPITHVLRRQVSSTTGISAISITIEMPLRTNEYHYCTFHSTIEFEYMRRKGLVASGRLSADI
jgi:hypothetical protein